jgi:hypothetical protein
MKPKSRCDRPNLTKARAEYIATLIPRVNENVEEVKKRHSQMAKLLLSSYKTTPQGATVRSLPNPGMLQPSYVEFIGLASNVGISFDTGRGTSTSLANENNILQTELIIGGGDNNPRVACDFNFFYGPPKGGPLKAWAFVAANGSATWNTQSTCWDTTRINSGADAYLTVQQYGPDGTLMQLPSVTGTDSAVLGGSDHEYGQDDHCLGDSGIDVVDGFQVIELPGYFPAVAGNLLQIIVSLWLLGYGYNATGDLDFLSKGRGINVIGVALQLF